MGVAVRYSPMGWSCYGIRAILRVINQGATLGGRTLLPIPPAARTLKLSYNACTAPPIPRNERFKT